MDPRDLEITEFKDYFNRGQFTYGTDPGTVRDVDIASAISEMQAVINVDLYPVPTTLLLIKLYLTAHFLFSDLKAINSQGKPSFVLSSRSADGISITAQVPDRMNAGKNDFYSTSYYGQKFLALSPSKVFCLRYVKGKTQP